MTRSPQRSPRRVTGDLFEHFGVPLEDRVVEPVPGAIAATPCPACGWYLRADGSDACPMCGGARPR